MKCYLSNKLLRFSIVLLVFSWISGAQAHELSTAYVNGNVNSEGLVSGEIKINILDLKEAIVLDKDENGELTWGEILAGKPRIHSYLNERLRFSQNSQQCRLSLNSPLALQSLSQNTMLVIAYKVSCENADINTTITLHYEILFDLIANHKAIVSISANQNEFLGIFDQDTSEQNFNLSSSNILNAFISFVYQGIFHILIGTDHILFLLTLLLTIVLVYKNNHWVPMVSKKMIVKRTFWLVTAFTIAHSITLSGTALGWLPVFGTWIEVIIAASIVFNVLNNIFPKVHQLSLITFVFGLVHGMGFAGALSELGLPEQQKILSVLAFNLGVEIGQIMILIVSLPLLIWLRNKSIYIKYLMPMASLAIGGLAIFWVVERTASLW